MLVQDVFDGELKEDIEPLYTEKVWSAIDDDHESKCIASKWYDSKNSLIDDDYIIMFVF